MRQLEKSNEPQVLVQKAAEWTDLYLQALREGNKPTPKWGHEEIRAVLREEVMSKCAYCESYVEHVSYAEVEHIIPKSVKPELVYQWSNLTGACRRCNGAKDNFYQEVNGLLNPYVDNIDGHLHFQGPLISSRLTSTCGEVTVRQLQLNRLDLLNRRAQRLEEVKEVLERWATTDDDGLRDVLEEGLRIDARNGEYSRSVIGFLASHGFRV